MSEFRINGRQATRRDFEVLRDSMGSIGEEFQAPFRDGDLSAQEMGSLLGRIGSNGEGGHVFRSVQGILGQYGFSLPRLGDEIEPTSFPHWCQDLGIRWCIPDADAPAGADGFLRSLADIPPEEFLPANLARFVRLCESARLNHDALTQEGCRTLAPLSQELTSVVIIPRDTVAQAQLPPTGARVVADCQGRHLQIRGDLPQERNLRLLRWAFADLYSIALSDFLAPYASSSAGQTDVSVCRVGVARAGDGVQPRPPSWRTSVIPGIWRLSLRADGGYASARMTPVPQAYVTQSCFTPGVADGRLPPRPSGVAGLFFIEAEVRRLQEGEAALTDDSEQCWDGCGGDSCTRCEAIDAQLGNVQSRLDSLNDEIEDRIVASPEILRDMVPEETAREEEYSRLCDGEVIGSLQGDDFERRNDQCNDLSDRFDMPDVAAQALSNHAADLDDEYYGLDCENPAVVSPRCTDLAMELERLEPVIADFNCSSLDVSDDCYFSAHEFSATRSAACFQLPSSFQP